MTDSPVDIFLSYAREDLAEATRLEMELSKSGLRVWFDKKSLAPGARWETAIEEAIVRARYFIALISSRSTTKRGFVQKEIRRALEVLDEYPEQSVYLIPVRLDACAPPHPRLADLNWTDLFPTWDDGLEKLRRYLCTHPDHAEPTPRLHVGGLYQSRKLQASGTFFRQYLRFSADGCVAGVSSTGEAGQVIKWLTVSGPNLRIGFGRGSYLLQGSSLKFSLTSDSGAVDHEGDILDDKLVLRVHSHINGHRDVMEYSHVLVSG
jgi:TIR domain